MVVLTVGIGLSPLRTVKLMIDCSKTENYFAEKRRMTKRTENGGCRLDCYNCPLYSRNNNKKRLCTDFEIFYPKEAIKLIQKWSDENPQRTYLTELLEKFPNTRLNEDGVPGDICPDYLGLKSDCTDSSSGNCVRCWNQAIEI